MEKLKQASAFFAGGDTDSDEERLNSHSCKKVLLRRSPAQSVM